MINQLSGVNSNPIHVLSAGAGDLLPASGSMSPTYQNFAFHHNNNQGAKLNPYFTSGVNQGVVDLRQQNSTSTGRGTRNQAQANKTSIRDKSNGRGQYQTINAAGGMSDRSIGGMEVSAANAYAGVTSNHNLMNHTIEPGQTQQQHSTATLIGTSNGRRAVSNPKTFMRARMAQ